MVSNCAGTDDRTRVLDELLCLREQYPDAYIACVDTYIDLTSVQDQSARRVPLDGYTFPHYVQATSRRVWPLSGGIGATALRSLQDTGRLAYGYTGTNPNEISGFMRCDVDSAFSLPWQLPYNLEQNVATLVKVHCFDADAAATLAALPVVSPAILLAKFALLQPTKDMMEQVTTLANAQTALSNTTAGASSNCTAGHTHAGETPRCRLPPPHFGLAIGPGLQIQSRFQRTCAAAALERTPASVPHGRVARQLPVDIASERVSDCGSNCCSDARCRRAVLAPALRAPCLLLLSRSDCSNRRFVAEGELKNIPIWLQGLTCTTSLRTTGSINISCHLPTKVYKLCLSKESRPEALRNAPRFIGKSEWKLETLGSIYKPSLHRNSSEFHCSSHNTDKNLVCSTILHPGSYSLDASLAVYFFDTSRFLQQRSMRASGAQLCKFMQRDGFCSRGDCCNYTHTMPSCFSPEVPVYIGCVYERCRDSICTSLRIPVPDQAPFLRARLYSKHQGHGHFQARRRVLGSGVMAFLINGLLFPNGTNRRSLVRAASQYLPMQIYRKLMVKSDNFDDNDVSTYIESRGYRFRTLSKRRHSPSEHASNMASMTHAGGARVQAFRFDAVPYGWEVCPPDEVSIAVCTNYSWQCAGLMLGDGKEHATQDCCCTACKLSSQPTRRPHLRATTAYSTKIVDGHMAGAAGIDVLLRRPCYPDFIPCSQKSEAIVRGRESGAWECEVCMWFRSRLLTSSCIMCNR